MRAEVGKKLSGALCWGVEWSQMLNLSMSFGPPHLEVSPVLRERKGGPHPRRPGRRRVNVAGVWWLWVYVAYWRIIREGTCLPSYSSRLRDKR